MQKDGLVSEKIGKHEVISLYELDHIVHFVDKPEKMPERTKQIGLHTVEGGKHKMWGTYNSLCYFGLSYIEFIGVFDEQLLQKAASIPYTLHETYIKNGRKNGFTRIALRTMDIAKDAEKFRRLGFEIDGPTSFSRIRPDGSVVKWKLLHIGKGDCSFDYPFFIQWDDSNEERFNQLVQNGTIQEHDLGQLEINEIHFVVNDLKIAKEWALLFERSIDEQSENVMKLKGENCLFVFEKSEKKNLISKVVFRNSKVEKEVFLENGLYFFTK